MVRARWRNAGFLRRCRAGCWPAGALLRTLGERGAVAFDRNGVMEELRKLDEVAYVRFASVYRRFQDVTEFQDEILRLQEISDASASREQMSLLPELLGNKK
jgi:transcriptional repressor NrdR